MTPLHCAARFGHVEVVKYLYHRQPNTPSAHGGLTPLHIASREGHLNVVSFLLTAYDTRLLAPTEGSTQAESRRQQIVHAYTAAGRHALYLAAEENRIEVVEYFVERVGINVDLPCSTEHNKTPIYLASHNAHNDPIVFSYLLRKGADLGRTNDAGWTLLHQAARSGSIQITKILLQKGLDFLAQARSFGNLPLHTAAQFGRGGLVKAYIDRTFVPFLEKPFNVNHPNKKGVSVLQVAVKYGKLDVVCMLLDQGADVSYRDSYGNTALLFAAGNSHKDIAIELLQRGAKMDDESQLGKTH